MSSFFVISWYYFRILVVAITIICTTMTSCRPVSGFVHRQLMMYQGSRGKSFSSVPTTAVPVSLLLLRRPKPSLALQLVSKGRSIQPPPPSPPQQQPYWCASSRSSTAARQSSTRLFGTRVDPDNPPGEIDFYDETSGDNHSNRQLDQDRLCSTLARIRRAIGYDTYDVTLILVDDDEMRSMNRESRNINAPTDILSFPFHAATAPGVLEEVQFDIPDYYMLGDLIVDVPYVMRRIQEDQQEQNNNNNTDDDDDEDANGVAVAGPVERGVSGAMANVFDLETRIQMLLIHGMLHLVGYDHEDDEEYEIMVAREEELLKEIFGK